ncbi:NAD(P)/FAD-dependent oxidoreductase [Aliiglaciecola sp. LCG003]|uniref:NAD(P)/FAD-dependent oxidoreductase n=1 Tax=Aliiglaciecola sp. LCG003 TaxID=3053655 RepID=UPI002573AC1A|nr:NAD(P)/FAD-dependent oxidoreductase [Aliiglaciecola sp. LCG003]WJG09882.1 NAD(P)/FAD-dependent oxidoreductase [Aliiglaciecola sp. LCG003]
MPIQVTADIAIVGAGVAGCIAAIALAPHFNVLLIDKDAQPPARIGECLPGVALRILKQLNIEEAFTQQTHLVSQGMESYWGSDYKQITDNITNPDGFGWYLNRPEFEVLLRKTALARGVNCMWQTKLIGSESCLQGWQLITDVAAPIRAKFVIDAGGRQSPFVRHRGIVRQQHDKLVSCWLTVPDQTEYRMGVIAASEKGWWYSAPIPGNKRVIAFQTDSDLLPPATRHDLAPLMEHANFCPEIAGLLADKAADSIEYHGVTTANSSRLVRGAGSNWAALGDSAVSFDPLSSQGMYNGMASAMQLAEILILKGMFDDHYQKQLDNIWHSYLQHKNLFYRAETRWKQREFWQRRIKIQASEQT